LRIQRGDAAIAVAHEAPLGGLVPMQLPHAAGGEAHVHARDGVRDLEIRLSDLTGPPAALDASRRVVERGPEQRKISDVGRGRDEGLWELPGERRVLRPRINRAARVSLGVSTPWDGSSGLPKLAPRARVARAPTPRPAPIVSISRREVGIVEVSNR
jgi:hypothetical protein